MVVGLISGLATLGLLYLSVNCIPYFTAGGIVFIPILLPLIVFGSHWCTNIFEKINSKRFILKAKTKLAKHTDLKVVGVTGSYGKTTVKNIIASILAEKYKVSIL